MQKQIATTLLLLCLITQTFSKAAIVGSYYVNTAEYAKNCVNKARPKLHCNGRCQMMKKMKQEEKKDSQNPERRGNSKNDVLSSKSFFASVQSLPVLSSIQNTILKSSAIQDMAAYIFHPPGEN